MPAAARCQDARRGLPARFGFVGVHLSVPGPDRRLEYFLFPRRTSIAPNPAAVNSSTPGAGAPLVGTSNVTAPASVSAVAAASNWKFDGGAFELALSVLFMYATSVFTPPKTNPLV